MRISDLPNAEQIRKDLYYTSIANDDIAIPLQACTDLKEHIGWVFGWLVHESVQNAGTIGFRKGENRDLQRSALKELEYAEKLIRQLKDLINEIKPMPEREDQ
jgi:hypothetical protein